MNRGNDNIWQTESEDTMIVELACHFGYLEEGTESVHNHSTQNARNEVDHEGVLNITNFINNTSHIILAGIGNFIGPLK